MEYYIQQNYVSREKKSTNIILYAYIVPSYVNSIKK